MQPEITIKISFQGTEKTGEVSIGERRESTIKREEELRIDQEFQVPQVPGVEESEQFSSSDNSGNFTALSVPTVEVNDVELINTNGLLSTPQIEEGQFSNELTNSFDFNPPELPSAIESRLINFEAPQVKSELLTNEYFEVPAELGHYANGNEGLDIPPLPEN